MAELSDLEHDVFAPGDRVTWKGADSDIPTGTVGHVYRVFDDGDVEVAFPTKKNDEQLIFTFTAERLEHASADVSAKQLASANDSMVI